MNISVIICTHNPCPDYLHRVLDALETQTLPRDQWELLLIDNASKATLGNQWDLSWHQHARHIREEELGLTPARLRGIKESNGELLVFVDDDNVLSAGYLAQTLSISRRFPQIAAYGGSLIGDYEVEPPLWFAPYRSLIAVREITCDRWSNNPEDSSSTPLGAGMIVARELGLYYLAQVQNNPARKALDRRGASLAGGGDIDLALMSCDIGYGKGVFKDLTLRHLIPAGRIKIDYLLRLHRSIAASVVLHKNLRGETVKQLQAALVPRFLRGMVNGLRNLRRSSVDRRMTNAWNHGVRDGIETVTKMRQNEL